MDLEKCFQIKIFLEKSLEFLPAINWAHVCQNKILSWTVQPFRYVLSINNPTTQQSVPKIAVLHLEVPKCSSNSLKNFSMTKQNRGLKSTLKPWNYYWKEEGVQNSSASNHRHPNVFCGKRSSIGNLHHLNW